MKTPKYTNPTWIHLYGTEIQAEGYQNQPSKKYFTKSPVGLYYFNYANITPNHYAILFAANNTVVTEYIIPTDLNRKPTWCGVINDQSPAVHQAACIIAQRTNIAQIIHNIHDLPPALVQNYLHKWSTPTEPTLINLDPKRPLQHL